jgi:hypothetical protein
MAVSHPSRENIGNHLAQDFSSPLCCGKTRGLQPQALPVYEGQIFIQLQGLAWLRNLRDFAFLVLNNVREKHKYMGRANYSCWE